MNCTFLRPGPRCVLKIAEPEQLPTACGTCKRYQGPSRGLGDVVHKVAQVTGVAAVVKKLAGEDCGCAGRRAALNRAVPFREGAD
jgi:hypothetical protein